MWLRWTFQRSSIVSCGHNLLVATYHSDGRTYVFSSGAARQPLSFNMALFDNNLNTQLFTPNQPSPSSNTWGPTLLL